MAGTASALLSISLPQPMTSNPQPKPYRYLRLLKFSPIRPKSRYVSIQENRAFRKASYDDANLTKSQSIRHFSALDFIFLTANRPSQRYFHCPNKVPVSLCLQNTPENGTLCASGICHLAAPARKCPPVPQSC